MNKEPEVILYDSAGEAIVVPPVEVKVEPPYVKKLFEHHHINGKTWFPPRGNTKAKLMLILSHPAFDDLKNRYLLSGENEQEVRDALAEAGIASSEVYITSMVKYGLGTGSKASATSIADCSEMLDYEINLVKPKLIMTLGAEPFKRIMKANRKQTDSIGEIIDSPYGKHLANYSPGMITTIDPKKRSVFRDIFELAGRYIKDKLNYTPFEYILVEDPAVNREIVAHYIANNKLTVAYDGEWETEHRMTDGEVMYTFQYCCEPNKAIILNLSTDGVNENRELLDTMKPLLEHPKADRLGWNIRVDDKRLTIRGFNLPDETLGFDGMKAMSFIDSRWAKGLETGLKKFTNYAPYYNALFKIEADNKIDAKDLVKVRSINPDAYHNYCAGDAVTTYTACINMRNWMNKNLPKKQLDYYFNTYLPLSNYFKDLELSGIPIDVKVMEEITEKYTTKYIELKGKLDALLKPYGYDQVSYNEYIKEHTDEEAKTANIRESFNPASSMQKKELLFEVLELTPAYYTKAGKAAKPRAWWVKQKEKNQEKYKPSSNSKSLSALKFSIVSEMEKPKVKNKVGLESKHEIIETLLDLNRVSVFSQKFLSKKGTLYEEEETHEDGEDPLKSSYWAAMCKDQKVRPDFFECLNNFRSSSKVNVQNPASKVLSHIPNIFVPGYDLMSKEDKAANEHLIPRNIRHIFYSGDPDWYWVECDVAGADLAIAAFLSQDPEYIHDILKGGFHTTKMREYFNDPTLDKDKDISRYVIAKSITFRVAYTSELLSAAMPIQAEIYSESGNNVDIKTLEYALKTWERYKKYIDYRENCKAQVRDYNFIENARGIKYHFEETENFGVLAGWLNESLAYPIASELALFIWDVSVATRQQFIKDKVWMKYVKPVNSVHDAAYWIIHKDLMKDDYFQEVCKHYFTQHCRIATGDRLGMEMKIADRWKADKKHTVFSKETVWDFKNHHWKWKD